MKMLSIFKMFKSDNSSSKLLIPAIATIGKLILSLRQCAACFKRVEIKKNLLNRDVPQV